MATRIIRTLDAPYLWFLSPKPWSRRYCLPNGDSGIIRTLDAPVYITRVFGNIIYCLDRDGKNRQIQARLLLCNLMQHCWVSIAPAGLVKRVMG